jgi:hypothetical protein
MMLINLVLKYAFIALAIAVSLKYILNVSMGDDALVKATLTLTLMVFLTECLLFGNMFEGMGRMDQVKYFAYDTMDRIPKETTISVEDDVIPKQFEPIKSCDNLNLTPTAFYDPVKDDLINTGLNFNNTLPGYFMVNNGQYTNGNVSNDKIKELIRESKFEDMVDQHNFNIIWSPHTHVGKNRGYINPEKVYPTD